MFVEVIYDPQGNITDCYCSQHLAVEGVPLIQKELPLGHSQARLNIDTVTMLEILDAKKDKAGLDGNGKPIIIKGKKSGAEVIKSTYVVDVGKPPVTTPVGLPPGLEMRELKKKP